MKHRALLSALILAVGLAQSQPKTLRVDYYHTGGSGLEVFSLDRIVLEPLPWPGPSRTNPPDFSGTYRFEVRDSAGVVLASQGFSTIFGEWITTSEAKETNRTFHESVRFPFPTAPVVLTIQKRGPDHAFAEVWRLKIDPNDMFIDRSNPPRQELLEIERNGDPTGKVDLLLIGDGYTATEIGKFKSDARRMAEAFFSEEPFRSRRKDFNIWGICPPSPQSGISRPSTGIYVSSPVGATYDVFGSERYILTFDNKALRTIASWAPNEFIVILTNTKTYGGGGIYNHFATAAVDNDWADYLFVHEFGHHFAGLADEYYTSPVAYEPPDRVTEPWEPNATALLDKNNLKWSAQVKKGTPVPTPWPKEEFESHAKSIQQRRKKIREENKPETEMSALFAEQQRYEMKLFKSSQFFDMVGAFQGANYDAKAFYRPEVDCIMFSRNDVPFCDVCTSALNAVIDRYVH